MGAVRCGGTTTPFAMGAVGRGGTTTPFAMGAVGRSANRNRLHNRHGCCWTVAIGSTIAMGVVSTIAMGAVAMVSSITMGVAMGAAMVSSISSIAMGAVGHGGAVGRLASRNWRSTRH